MKNTFGVVYGIVNEKGYLFYIGKTTKPIKTRLCEHLSAANRLKRSYLHNTLLASDSLMIIEIEFAYSEFELNELEIMYIKLKKRIKLVSIQPSPAVRSDRKSNATQIPPVSGEDIFRQFFGKN